MAASSRSDFDVAVIGGGATGLAAALTAARSGLTTLVFAPPAAFPPGRTAALLQGSIDLLRSLGVWDDLAERAAPLEAIRLVDATGRLIRAPEVTFRAAEVGYAAFGYNVPNGDLVEALSSALARASAVTVVREPAALVEPREGEARVAAPDGSSWSARLAVGADGARSVARAAAGLGARTWAYRQSALVTTLNIERPHDNVSTEFHTEAGPFTLVPMPGRRMSLVWVDRPERLAEAAAMEEAAFDRAAEARAASIVGAMRVDSPRAVFPLHAALAERIAANRILLVGEAAHVFPPIGAQGLNLGFRDVAAFGSVLARHRADVGAPGALAAYQRMRAADIRSRTLAVDLLNRSLLTGFLPVQIARGLGLAAAGAFPPLRRLLIRQGLAHRPGIG